MEENINTPANIAYWMAKGNTVEMAEGLLYRQGLTEEQVEPLITEAVSILKDLPPELDLAVLTAKAKMRESNADDIAPPERITKFANKLKRVYPVELLQITNNAIRRKKKGVITYEDIAFMGLIHAYSVNNNYKNGDKFASTAPKSRIIECSTRFGYRTEPFDGVQVGEGVDVLIDVEFTTLIRKQSKGIAAAYSLSQLPYWTSIFE